MNAKQVIAALPVFTATGSVFAGDNGIFFEYITVPLNKTHAEVRAELTQPCAAEHIAANSEFVEHTNVTSPRSRKEVRGEAIQAARIHSERALHVGSRSRVERSVNDGRAKGHVFLIMGDGCTPAAESVRQLSAEVTLLDNDRAGSLVRARQA